MKRIFLYLLLIFASLAPSSKVNGNANNFIPQRDSIDTLETEPRLSGIDVSRYQYNIDWHRIKGIHFVFMKATEGTKISDPSFRRNWDSSKSVGVLRGAYHFYRPYVSAVEQFRHFSNRVVLEKGDLPPVLDLEVRSRNPVKMKGDIKRWLLLAEDHYGIRPIIYCTHAYRKTYLADTFFSKYPYWIANYALKDLDCLTEDWRFWQYSPKGRISGIRSAVDLNHFKGSLSDLAMLCKQ